MCSSSDLCYACRAFTAAWGMIYDDVYRLAEFKDGILQQIKKDLEEVRRTTRREILRFRMGMLTAKMKGARLLLLFQQDMLPHTYRQIMNVRMHICCPCTE